MSKLPLTLTALLLTAAASAKAADLPPIAHEQSTAPVTLTDNGQSWTLDNGIVQATILKRNGSMPSLIFHGINTMGDSGGTWESSPRNPETSVTIDPKTNNGQRAEVSVKGPAGPRAFATEIRYALEKNQPGIYVYAIYSHGPDDGPVSVGEDRYITRLNRDFNWISVDKDRNLLECTPADWGAGTVIHAKEQRILPTGYYKNSVEHKYSYNAIQYTIPAWGWSSTKNHIGVYMINPSTEYLAGGASKMDLVAHFDANDNPCPIILDYWCSGHYAGGANCNVPAGLVWNRVVGPIFVYCNALQNPTDATPQEMATLNATAGNPTVPETWKQNGTALFEDALARAKTERAAWPYNWVNGVDYPHKDGRVTVTGQLVLNDPQAKNTSLPNLTVGLAHPDYQGPDTQFARRAGNGTTVTWPHDGVYYQFWNQGHDDGRFEIPNVRPGHYTLHAFADGVLGEFAKTDIDIPASDAGKPLDLGKLTWSPERDGKQLWEIGYPNRNASEFFKGDGDNYWLWGWYLRYTGLFPNGDLVYTIGQSEPAKDWFLEQTPRAPKSQIPIWVNPAAKDPFNQRFGWIKTFPKDGGDPWREIGRGDATTWTINFNMPAASTGTATLRIALGGADGNGGLAIGVNGKPVGDIHPVATNALRYNTDRGVWHEYKQPFPASLLHPGQNSITLTVPPGDLTTGVVYDYLRLELKE
ncbi:MAG TPA: polysaccharide lyase family protein [Phycisphaerae bacterium]|nr:polysaccharide lyase family protein [Phycisphaerae bacterium]